MAKIGNIYIGMAVDTRAFSKGIATVRKSLDNLRSNVTTTSALIAGAFTGAAGATLLKFAKAAGSAGEATGKLQAVFKGSAGDVSAFIDQMVTAYGMGRTTLLDLSGQLGNLLNGAGLDPATVSAYSKSIIGLANDLSRFNDTSFGEAFEKIRAGLSGESEPLKAFGILLNEDAVKAKALEMGLGGANRALTESEKIQARMAIIWQKSTDALGTASREVGGFSSQMEALAGRWENLQTTIGQYIVPVLTPALEEVNTLLLAMSENFDKAAVSAVKLGGAAKGGKWSDTALGWLEDAGWGLQLANDVSQEAGLSINRAVKDFFGFSTKSVDEILFPLARKNQAAWNAGRPSLQMDKALEEVKGRQEAARAALAKPIAPPAPVAATATTAAAAAAATKTAPVKEAVKKAAESGEGRYSGAYAAASREAANVVLKSRYGSARDDAAKSAKETAANTKAAAAATIDLGKKFGEWLTKQSAAAGDLVVNF